MLELKNVSKSFGDVQILKDVDLKVNTGEVVAILGSSGSGKTTLLRIASFLEKADKGFITLDEFSYDLTKATNKEIQELRMHMGFVFQEFNVFNNMTALQNVMEGLVTARKMDKKAARDIAEKSLEKVGLGDRMDYYPSELSGGQKQRVAIARAIAVSPRVILFDEPTSALDPSLKAEVLDVVRKLAKEGTTMIIVTHEVAFAEEVADKIVYMQNING